MCDNTHRRDFDTKFLDAKFLHEFPLNGLPGLGAQAAHALVGVVPGERSQVHAGDRAQKPCRLPFLLHRSPGYLRLGAALHCARIHPNVLEPIQVERNARVAKERPSIERCDRARGIRIARCDLAFRRPPEIARLVIYCHCGLPATHTAREARARP